MARKARYLVMSSLPGCLPDMTNAHTNVRAARSDMRQHVRDLIECHSTMWNGDIEVRNPDFAISRWKDGASIQYTSYGGCIVVDIHDVRGCGYHVSDYEW